MKLDLDQVQGNIFGGFNKDFQDFLFLKVTSPANARAWIRASADGIISSSTDVLKYNNTFKRLTREGVARPELLIPARWANIGFSFKGLKALGLTETDFGRLPDAFTQGMAHRKHTIGDEGASDPAHWQAPFQPAQATDIHAILLVAADNEAELNTHVTFIEASAGFGTAFTVLGTVNGRTRMEQASTIGHEHFGFKDGVSQPALRGINAPDDPLANPDQGHPGQDLLWPGEFVLGYPTQIPSQKPGHTSGPNPDPGPMSTAGNHAWTHDGSFLVFRRLAQDVPAFEHQLHTLATSQGLSMDLVGAKLVGRYKSGCPLEVLSGLPFSTSAPSTDPGMANPTLANSDALNNSFEFEDDARGSRCPMSAHIRKAYPRDEDSGHGEDSESETQTHRLLRRGIPYGASFDANIAGSAAVARGLCFLAYQADIASHFEFVQKTWVNDPTFPPENNTSAQASGQDPIIAQSVDGPFEIKPGTLPITVKHFVTTTGGEYFFAPSLQTLAHL
ncbi:MAG: Dyp-type peroxidase [Burkholderiaceae bacterium]